MLIPLDEILKIEGFEETGIGNTYAYNYYGVYHVVGCLREKDGIKYLELDQFLKDLCCAGVGVGESKAEERAMKNFEQYILKEK